MLLGRHTDELSDWLCGGGCNATLPSEAMPCPGGGYAGRARVFVPTVRALVEKDEVLRISATVLAAASVRGPWPCSLCLVDRAFPSIRILCMYVCMYVCVCVCVCVLVAKLRRAGGLRQELSHAKVVLHRRALGAVERAAGPSVAMVQETVGRGVFHGNLGAIASDMEWYVSVDLPSGRLLFPPAAPASWQSVVVIP
jgi:hypothetical protein